MACSLETTQNLNKTADVNSRIKKYNEIILCKLNNSNPEIVISLIDELIIDLEKAEFKSTLQSVWNCILDVYKKDDVYVGFIKLFVVEMLTDDVECNKFTMGIMQQLLKAGGNEERLMVFLSNCDHKQLVKIFKLNHKDISQDVCFKYIHFRVIPQIFTNMEVGNRDDLMDLVMVTPFGFAYTYMSSDIIQKFKNNIINKYLPQVATTQNGAWFKYCKLLIHYCGKLLHNEIELTNSILRLVENGFKTKTIPDRVGSYECWKMLIENYNLDPSYLKQPKQIRLLIKPLKASLSRNTTISLKRFDAYTFFIEKTENRSFSCLEDYLHYCFGPHDEETKKKMGCAFTELYPKSTEVLLKFIGHQKKSPCCKHSTYLTDIYDIKQFLNSDNFHVYADLFVSCVRVCSELTIQWTSEEDGEAIINCLWRSIIKLLLNAPYDNQRKIVKVMYNNICIIIKKYKSDQTYCDKVLKPLMKCVIIFLLQIETYNIIFHDELVFPLIHELISEQLNNSNYLSKVVQTCLLEDMLNYCKRNKHFLKNMSELFKDASKTCLTRKSILLYCIQNINEVFDKENPEESKKIIINLFQYSIFLTLSAFDWTTACEIQGNTVLPDLKSILTKELKNTLQINPRLFSSIFKMSVMFLDTVTRTEQPIFNDLMYIFWSCFATPPKMDQSNDLAEYKKSIKRAIEIWKKNDFDENEYMYKCFKELLTVHRVYNVLPILNDFITMLTISQRQKVQKILNKTIIDLTTNKNTEVTKDALKILSRFNSVKNTTSTPVQLSRAAKISNMAITSPKPTESPKSNMVRLFGHDIDTLSPAKLKGSMLEKTLTISSPKVSNIMPVFKKKTQDLNNFKDNDFVPIKKEITLELSKLNDHQMEVIKKKRDDIPALYQDLSQSVSQSLDISINKIKENAENAIDILDVKKSDNSEIKLNKDIIQLGNTTTENGDVKSNSITSINSSTETDSGPIKKKRGRRPFKAQTTTQTLAEENIKDLPKAEQESVQQEDNKNTIKETKKNSRKVLTPPLNSNQKRRVTRKSQANMNENTDKEKEEIPDKLGENSSKEQSKENQRGNSETEEVKCDKLSKSAQRALAHLKIDMVNSEKVIIPRKRISKRKSFSDDEIVEFTNNRRLKNKMNEIKEISEEKQSSEPLSNKEKELDVLSNKHTSDKETKDMNNTEKQTVSIENCILNNQKDLEHTDNVNLNNSTEQNVNITADNEQDILIEKEDMVSEDIIEESPPIDNTPIKDSRKKVFDSIRVSLFKVETSTPNPHKLLFVTDDLQVEKSLLPDTETLDICSEDANVPICDMDTESIINQESASEADLKNTRESTDNMSSLNLAISDYSSNGTLNNSKLVTSPIMSDTPDRNSMLYNDTLHISPIKKIEHDDICNSVIQNGICNDNFDKEDDYLKENFDITEKIKSDHCSIVLKSPSIRSAKLLNLLPNPPILKTHKNIIEITKPLSISSPKTDRIRKMLMNCGDQNKTEENVTNEEEEINSTDVLKFDREVPSPYAKPKISILKRKMPDTTEEGLSPCPKRKRVNFSDPPTSCQKIYFKEIEEKTRFRKAKRKSLNTMLNIKSKSDGIGSIQNIQLQIDNLSDGIIPLEISTITSEEQKDGVLLNDELVPLINSPSELEETPNTSFSILSNITVKEATDGKSDDETSIRKLIENINMVNDNNKTMLTNNSNKTDTAEDSRSIEEKYYYFISLIKKSFRKDLINYFQILGVNECLPIMEDVLKTQLDTLAKKTSKLD